jgi:hypothetical protein
MGENKNYQEVPVSAAKEVAENFDKQEIILLSIDREFDKVHITTFGTNEHYSKNAEITGDFLAEIFQLREPEVYFEIIEQAKQIWKNRKKK